MKTTKIQDIPNLKQISTIEDFKAVFAKAKPHQSIDQVNWSESFPAKPDTNFVIARSKDSLFIHYQVKEQQIKAIYTKDQDPVWQDSCVEFFCQLPGRETYFNFEFNCIGTCLATERKGRTEDVQPLSPEKMAQIKRYPSLGKTSFEEQKGNFEWTLTVEIPFEILGLDAAKLPESIKGNFYKCGDETSVPHYVSWNPIHLEKPDFHRPDFFGELNF